MRCQTSYLNPDRQAADVCDKNFIWLSVGYFYSCLRRNSRTRICPQCSRDSEFMRLNRELTPLGAVLQRSQMSFLLSVKCQQRGSHVGMLWLKTKEIPE